MQHDSAPAAANFINLLFIAISLDIEVPWRDSVRCSPAFWLFGTSHQRCVAKVGLMLRHFGRGGLPHRVTVDGPRETASHCRGRLPKIISTPIADVLEEGASINAMLHRDEIEAAAGLGRRDAR